MLFALTLLGVALLHRRALEVAATGLAVITLYKLAGDGLPRRARACRACSRTSATSGSVLANLFLLLLGFALLSRHFEESHVPGRLPDLLPDDWRGGFLLLVLVFVLSSFLDNIAAALIGGTVAKTVFRGRVHVGYLAALVAASNAGGSGSVIGDTTTTMMWIDGVSPLDVLHAYVAAVVALLVCGIPAALQQQRLLADRVVGHRARSVVDWPRVGSRRDHPGRSDHGQRRRQPALRGLHAPRAVHRARDLGRDPGHRGLAAPGLGGAAGRIARHDLPAVPGDRGVA